MTYVDYIAESLSICLEEIVDEDVRIPFDVNELAKALAISLEMWSEFSGSINIPNPLTAEVERVRSLRTKDNREWERREEFWRQKEEEYRREISRLRWKMQERPL